jgi:hypothetical protein
MTTVPQCTFFLCCGLIPFILFCLLSICILVHSADTCLFFNIQICHLYIDSFGFLHTTTRTHRSLTAHFISAMHTLHISRTFPCITPKRGGIRMSFA